MSTCHYYEMPLSDLVEYGSSAQGCLILYSSIDARPDELGLELANKSCEVEVVRREL
jgi:hypothetical protein